MRKTRDFLPQGCVRYDVYRYIYIQRESSHFTEISDFSPRPPYFPSTAFFFIILLYRLPLSSTVLYPKQSNLEPVAAAPTCDCQVTIYIPAHLYNNLLTRYVFLARETLSQFRAFLLRLSYQKRKRKKKYRPRDDIVANGLISYREISIFFFFTSMINSNRCFEWINLSIHEDIAFEGDCVTRSFV